MLWWSGGAPQEGAGAPDVIADLEAEAFGEEGPGGLVVGGAEHGVAKLARHDPAGAQHAGGAHPGSFVAAGAVVSGRGYSALLGPAGDLQHGAGAGRLLDRAEAVRLEPRVDSQPGQVAGRAGQVVGVVHAHAQFDQPPGGGLDDPQLATGVAGSEPAVIIGRQPEFSVVGGGIRHVRYAHGDGGQAVQSHRRLPFLGRCSHCAGDEPVPEFADALYAADEFVSGSERAGEDDVAGQQRQHGGLLIRLVRSLSWRLRGSAFRLGRCARTLLRRAG